MKLMNIGTKIINVGTRVLMPGDDMPISEEMAKAPAIQALIEKELLSTDNKDIEFQKAVEEAARKMADEAAAKSKAETETKAKAEKKAAEQGK